MAPYNKSFRVLHEPVKYCIVLLGSTIGILPANTRYRLVGKANPYLVENVGQVEGAGQLHLSKVCKRMS